MGAHNPILKDLLNVRQGVDELRLDMSDVKARMTAVEITMGRIVSLIATQSGRMDRIDDRLGRVERRLDLADA
jgi:hypothetical protein